MNEELTDEQKYAAYLIRQAREDCENQTPMNAEEFKAFMNSPMEVGRRKPTTNKIPTAKEFFKEQLSGETLTEESVIEGLIDFAKLHVEAALKRASESAYCESEGLVGDNDTESYIVDKQSILKAYPLTNIK